MRSNEALNRYYITKPVLDIEQLSNTGDIAGTELEAIATWATSFHKVI